jgi:hypothetical protein
MPNGRSGNKYSPAEEVAVVRATPVASWTAVTLASLMAAPETSCTEPLMAPRKACARAAGAHRIAANRVAAWNNLSFDMCLEKMI